MVEAAIAARPTGGWRVLTGPAVSFKRMASRWARAALEQQFCRSELLTFSSGVVPTIADLAVTRRSERWFLHNLGSLLALRSHHVECGQDLTDGALRPGEQTVHIERLDGRVTPKVEDRVTGIFASQHSTRRLARALRT